MRFEYVTHIRLFEKRINHVREMCVMYHIKAIFMDRLCRAAKQQQKHYFMLALAE